MSKVHFLNVDPGDCTVIEHNSDRVSMIDICDGFTPEEISRAINSQTFKDVGWKTLLEKTTSGNFRMKENLTNPIEYLESIGIESIFRFILTHPDMDHMDGLNALAESFDIINFWDTGVKKDKPDFSGSPYNEKDWDQYINFLAGKNIKSIKCLAGKRFPFANQKENNGLGGDGLYILAPDEGLVSEANKNGDVNDASYVLLYRSSGGRILFMGDAHDKTCDYILDKSQKDVVNCSVMIAPHHGRNSGRTFDFLDQISPKFTLFGNAPSEYLAYNEWRKRGLPFITSNQAGNIVLECEKDTIKIFVENESFAKKAGQYSHIHNDQGYYLYDVINSDDSETSAQLNKSSLSYILQ